MEENYLGYVLGALDPETQRRVETLLSEQPEAQHHVSLLRRAIGPLVADRDTIDPPDDLALRTIGRVAEHIVNTEGSVASEASVGGTAAEFIRSLIQPAVTAPADAPTPVYPVRTSEAMPPSWSPRNLIVSGGLTIALLMILFAAIVSVRQTRELQACQNNLRAMHHGISSYCTVNNERCPQVAAENDVREVFRMLNDRSHLARNVTFACPGTGNTLGFTEVNGKSFIPSAGLIEYAYCLGYRDELGNLNGLQRGNDNENFPILADAPKREGQHALPINHRRGQNVLFLGGHVRFCTNPNVGPIGDDIYYNTVLQPKAGTHRWDSVLGRANEKP